MNAVRYGVSGAHLLLPGEDATEYERHLDSYFAELVPTSMRSIRPGRHASKAA